MGMRGCVLQEYEKQDGIYRIGSLIVAPNLPEVVVAGAYLRFAKEDLLGQIFYEGIPSMVWFLNEFRKPDTHLLGCYQRVGDMADLRGLGWVNKITAGADGFRRAEVGIAFFRGTTLRSVKFGGMMVDWIFENCKLDMIYGTTPVPNEPAWKYARALGMTLAGPVPNFTSWNGELCGVWISSLSRKDWQTMRG
jgi:hypothetical protein